MVKTRLQLEGVGSRTSYRAINLVSLLGRIPHAPHHAHAVFAWPDMTPQDQSRMEMRLHLEGVGSRTRYCAINLVHTQPAVPESLLSSMLVAATH